MKYQPRIANCNVCDCEFNKTRVAYVTCAAPECVIGNRKLRDKKYQKNRGKPKTPYKGLILDSQTPDVHMKNKFILGLHC